MFWWKICFLPVKYFCCVLRNFAIFNGSFLLTRNQRVVSVKFLAFRLFTSNANALACKVVVNGARVCVVKNRIVIMEFMSKQKFSIT